MKVILIRDVPNLGKAGEVREVAPGYARNHLLPRGFAEAATAQRLKEWEKRREKADLLNSEQESEALKLAENISQKTLLFNLPAGEGGRLFGSVTSADLAEKLTEAGINVDKKKIELPEPIKSLGDFTALVRLHHGVKADLAVRVEKET